MIVVAGHKNRGGSIISHEGVVGTGAGCEEQLDALIKLGKREKEKKKRWES